MSDRLQQLDALLYPHLGAGWDNKMFREEMLGVVDGHALVLDLGAGAGIIPEMRLSGHVGKVCGVDPDASVLGNPYLDEAIVGRAESIPYPDGHFDLVVANNVLEHLEFPERAFEEIARVLKPGGRCVAKTPNRWHYVPIIASCTPHRFHEWINERRGRRASDTFPTHYRVNSRAAVHRLAARAGLIVERLVLIEGRPEYLRMTVPTYLAGWLYERCVNRLPGMWRFRAVMLLVLWKVPSSGMGAGPQRTAA
ncbi:MAG: class I SAM-dependent methyltransferase [Pirellulales bacterium]